MHAMMMKESQESESQVQYRSLCTEHRSLFSSLRSLFSTGAASSVSVERMLQTEKVHLTKKATGTTPVERKEGLIFIKLNRSIVESRSTSLSAMVLNPIECGRTGRQ